MQPSTNLIFPVSHSFHIVRNLLPLMVYMHMHVPWWTCIQKHIELNKLIISWAFLIPWISLFSKLCLLFVICLIIKLYVDIHVWIYHTGFQKSVHNCFKKVHSFFALVHYLICRRRISVKNHITFYLWKVLCRMQIGELLQSFSAFQGFLPIWIRFFFLSKLTLGKINGCSHFCKRKTVLKLKLWTFFLTRHDRYTPRGVQWSCTAW